MFDTHEAFQTEYFLMHDDTRIADHFGLIRDQELNGLSSRTVPFPPGMIPPGQTTVPFHLQNLFYWQ